MYYYKFLSPPLSLIICMLNIRGMTNVFFVIRK